MVMKFYVSWCIQVEVDSEDVLAEAGRGTLSPDLADTAGSTRFNRQHWQVAIGGRWVEDETFSVTKKGPSEPTTQVSPTTTTTAEPTTATQVPPTGNISTEQPSIAAQGTYDSYL